jgi:hypothetical protein
MVDVDGLRELAASQGGVFTPRQAESCGWSHHAILTCVARGQWRRLHRGVLVEAEWLASLPPVEQHGVRLRGRLLLRPNGWHAARRSAALVHGLPIIGSPPTIPQLVRDKTVLSLRGNVRHERISTLPPEERTEIDVPVTSLARTVVDVARDECFRNAVVVADAALRSGASAAELLQVARRCSTWPGGSSVLPVVAFADGLAETPLESISRVAFQELGVAAPRSQVEVWLQARFVARVDFLWEACNVVGESDGRSKYVTVEDLYREKRREEWLRDLGFEVVRWDWAAVYRPTVELAETLNRALSRGRLNQLAPGVRLQPTQAVQRAA